MAAKLAETVFECDYIMDINKGDEIALNELFSVDGYGKPVELLSDVSAGASLTIKVNKMEPFKAKAEADRKGGDKVILSELVQYPDLTRKQKALEDIKRLENLTVSIEID
jgi:alanyl-tRNA synthetase